jgi:hypothetical protein
MNDHVGKPIDFNELLEKFKYYMFRKKKKGLGLLDSILSRSLYTNNS